MSAAPNDVGGVFAGCVSLRPAHDAHRLEHSYLTPHLPGGGIGAAVLCGLLEHGRPLMAQSARRSDRRSRAAGQTRPQAVPPDS